MAHSSLQKETIKTVLVGIGLLVVALIIGQCAVSSAGAAETSPVVVTKLRLNANDQPGVRISTEKRIAVLISRPGATSTADDLQYQKAGTTKVYRLPAVKDGQAAVWYVNTYSPQTGLEYTNHRFVWRNYQRQVADLNRAAPRVGPIDVYAEVHPKRGGRMVVKVVKVRLIQPDGTVRWAAMTHAYTDEENGVQVYVRTVRRDVAINDVAAWSVYGSLQNVSASPVMVP
jgi:hypothetical protein